MPSDELSYFYPALSADQSELDQMRYELARRAAPPKPANWEATKEIPTPENIAYGNYLADVANQQRLAQTKATTPQGAFMERVVSPYVEPALTIGTGMAALPLAAAESLLKQGVTKGLELTNVITPAERAELLRKTPSIEQQVAARTYVPRSEQARDVVENIGQFFEESKIPHAWPVAGGRAPTRPMLTPDDVRVMGAQVAKTKREIQDIPIDFPNARQGAVRLDQFDQPTIGARLGMAANEAESVGQALDLPFFTDTAPVGAVKPVGGQLLVPKPFGKTLPERDLTGTDLAVSRLQNDIDPVSGASSIYEKPSPANLISTYVTQFDDPNLFLADIQGSFFGNKIRELFPDAPDNQTARQAFLSFYDKSEHNAFVEKWFNEFLESPELKTRLKDAGIELPSFAEFRDRIDAARQWITGPYTQYLQKFLGTEKDPFLAEAEKGITAKPAADLLSEFEAFKQDYPSVLNKVKESRKAFNQPVEGAYAEPINQKAELVGTLQTELRGLTAERQALGAKLIQENPNRDPASDPTYAATTNPIRAKERELVAAQQDLDNLRLAQAYEFFADASIVARTAKDVKKNLSYIGQKFFPGLEKVPDVETLYSIKGNMLDITDYDQLGKAFVRDVMSGAIPISNIKNVPIVKFLQQLVEPRLKEERANKLAEVRYIVDLQQKLLDDVNAVGVDKNFGNAAVIELTNALPKDEVARILSADTEVLDHCVASGGPGGARKHFLTGNSRNHEPVANPITGVRQSKFSESNLPSYIREVDSGEQMIASIRDTTSGYPVGTIQFLIEQDRKRGQLPNLSVGYVGGYQNGLIERKYAPAVAKYLNTISDRLPRGVGDKIMDMGVFDRKESYDMRSLANTVGVDPGFLDNVLSDSPRFVTKNDAQAALDAVATTTPTTPAIATSTDTRPALVTARENRELLGTGTLDRMRRRFDSENALVPLYESRNLAVNTAYEIVLESIEDSDNANDPYAVIRELRNNAENALDEEFADHFLGLTTANSRTTLSRILNSHAQIMQDNLAPATPERLYGVGRAMPDAITAYEQILRANNHFTDADGQQALAALLDFLRRPNMLDQFGVENLPAPELDQLWQSFSNLYQARERAGPVTFDELQFAPANTEQQALMQPATLLFDEYYIANNGFDTPAGFEALVDLARRAEFAPDTLPPLRNARLQLLPEDIRALRTNLETALISKVMAMGHEQYVDAIATEISDIAARTGNYAHLVPAIRYNLQSQDLRTMYDSVIRDIDVTQNLETAISRFTSLLNEIDNLQIDLGGYQGLNAKIDELTNAGMSIPEATREVLAPLAQGLDYQILALQKLYREFQQQQQGDVGQAEGGRIGMAKGGAVKSPTLAQMRAEMILRNYNA